MAYFTKDFALFFSDLENNNNKEWFHANKKRYEDSVKNPFHSFVDVLITELSDIYPDLTITPKDAIFRINRDIRFSKDKSPYKTHSSALISPGGKKDKTTPAMYVQANHKDIRVYSGCHFLEKDQLYNVRKYITANLAEFNRIISDKKFVGVFSEILGEKNKRIDSEFQPALEKQPLIANKSYYYFFKESPEVLISDNLISDLINKYRIALPLNTFLEKGLQG